MEQPLEVGWADRQLDRLIQLESAARARSSPAEARGDRSGGREAVAQPGRELRAVEEGRGRMLEGPGLAGGVGNSAQPQRGNAISDGERHGGSAVLRGDGGRERPTGADLAGAREGPANVPGDPPGVREGQVGSLGNSQEVQGRPADLPDHPPGIRHGDLLFDGLPQGFDPGQGGWHADHYSTGFVAGALEEQMMLGGVGPRRLDFQRPPQLASLTWGYPQGVLQGGVQGQRTAADQPHQQVNAFWSPEARRRVMEEQGTRGCGHPTTTPMSFGPAVHHGGSTGNVSTLELRPPPHNVQDAQGHELDQLRQRILREAEETFAREARRLREGSTGDVGSYHTATSGAVSGPGAQPQQYSPGGQPAQRPAQPGASPQLGSQPNAQASPLLGQGPRVDVPVGMTQPYGFESLRTHDLPALPPAGPDSALMFGDWLTVVSPIMSDISPAARLWWSGIVREVGFLYDQSSLSCTRCINQVVEQNVELFYEISRRSRLEALLPIC